ncbi:hypothetical protein LZ554_000573 [Drepanopeziza brunnea f. sp. 'monogermtubi']|nr:hypothetical protein LZ554_000573 [Drepanopeziza brunnea f. sp. 'monogermtubi']
MSCGKWQMLAKEIHAGQTIEQTQINIDLPSTQLKNLEGKGLEDEQTTFKEIGSEKVHMETIDTDNVILDLKNSENYISGAFDGTPEVLEQF